MHNSLLRNLFLRKPTVCLTPLQNWTLYSYWIPETLPHADICIEGCGSSVTDLCAIRVAKALAIP